MNIDIASISTDYGKPVSGIVHVGANDGMEIPDYLAAGVRHIKLFEPLAAPFARLQAKIAETPDNEHITAHNFALGAEEKSSQMHVADNGGASSSLLEPMAEKRVWKKIHFEGNETVEIRRMASFLGPQDPHNLLLLDVQGYELEVLKGSADVLPRFDYLICELNRVPSYKGSARVADVDAFLLGAGFRRMRTHWVSRYWGDALYVRETLPGARGEPVEIDFKKHRGPLKTLLYRLIGRT